MNYELAKKLKDAGFPQGLTEHQYGWVEAHGKFELDEGDMTSGVSAPTLSELIAACGERFCSLKREWGDIWLAYAFKDEQNKRPIDISLQTQGSTAELAVAQLWLELNKKHD